MATYWPQEPVQASTAATSVNYTVRLTYPLNGVARPEEIGSSGASVPTTGQIWPRGSKA